MTVTITFCTSTAVDRKLLDRINHAYDNNPDEPLRREPGMQPPPPKFMSARERKVTEDGDVHSRDQPHIFEGWSDEKCAKFYETTFEGERFIDYKMFATLDEQSVKDDTVVIHHRRYEDKVWESWRVKFQDAFFMEVGLTENFDDYDRTISQADRFIDSNGVFPVREAAKIRDREIQKSYKAAGQL